MNCYTNPAQHHLACDCREAMMGEICEYILQKHKEDNKINICYCYVCVKARILTGVDK